MPLIKGIVDLDTHGGLTPPLPVTEEQSKLLLEFLDQDDDWDSTIVRITWVNEETVEFTRLETYRRGASVYGGQR
jgi:transposase